MNWEAANGSLAFQWLTVFFVPTGIVGIFLCNESFEDEKCFHTLTAYRFTVE